MGIFDTIKKNLTQGGVDVEIYTQPVISKSAPHAVVVRVIAKDGAAQIKGIRLTLERSDPRNNVAPNTATRNTVVAQQILSEAFVLNQGEVRDVTMHLSLQNDTSSNVFAQVSSAINKIGEFMNNGQYLYTLIAAADVEGIALDPSSKVSVQVVDGGIAPPPVAPTPQQQ